MKENKPELRKVNRTIDKLSKICGMLGSAHDGERASAALLATQILDDLNITWSELIPLAFAGKHQEKTTVNVEFDDRPPGWHVPYCDWLIANKTNTLGKWEIGFLGSLRSRYAKVRLTEKQAKYLLQIAKNNGLEI